MTAALVSEYLFSPRLRPAAQMNSNGKTLMTPNDPALTQRFLECVRTHLKRPEIRDCILVFADSYNGFELWLNTELLYICRHPMVMGWLLER